ncbi:MAG: DUF5615 family PIN-like protein [Bacillota bacterium]
MKFFLDENFPKSSGNLLLELGHEAFDIRGTEHEGADDEMIFTFAQQKEAIFLTTDRDFFHTIPYLHSKHFGIIVFNFSQPNRFNIREKLELVLKNIDLENFDSKVLLLTDTRYTLVEPDKS